MPPATAGVGRGNAATRPFSVSHEATCHYCVAVKSNGPTAPEAGAGTLPYGTWPSPITAASIVAETVGIGSPWVDGDTPYWLESRPGEGGRNVVVTQGPTAPKRDVTPAGFSVRSRVHEYGGGAFAVHRGIVFFSNNADGRIYAQAPDGAPRPLTPEGPWHYADIVVDASRRRIICVREDHGSPGEPVNTLVAVSWEGDDAGTVLVAGHDFVASPRLSPDARRLAWISWEHPRMPWDGSELWLAGILENGDLGPAQPVAGGEHESVFQPAWSPGGRLYFVSDRTGWWNLYRWEEFHIEPLFATAADFGLPQWVFGQSTYGFTADDQMVCLYTMDGEWFLARIDGNGTLWDIPVPYRQMEDVAGAADGVYLIGGAPDRADELVRVEPASGRVEVVARAGALHIPAGCISNPTAFSFPTGSDETAHGFYYPPRNDDYSAPAGELPPLIVRIHGGPTAAATLSLRPDYQYWTSRGFAILDVNYRGSTGYGRAYRQRLYGGWGEVDVEDCIAGASHLVYMGWVDPQRLIIRGSSAGGYTMLAAVTFQDFFKTGASLYGISDLETLARDTHKFESHYLEQLVGPYPAARQLYHSRSPLYSAHRITAPVIFLQGLEDKVVPPSQAEGMVAALKKAGTPVAYVPFPDEHHGFRQAANIQRALESELAFYLRVFGLPGTDALPELEIHNMPI